ncbi:helix-turn-helix domain-containing protein [Mesorhizobium sp. M0306]|uniref:TetR/AcrR family transcriptional regulator n=1 Tax=Mesorhizobium sp. M0306 TaxID=2956932 RepID=UPI00333A2E90
MTPALAGPYAKSAQRSIDILDAAATVFATHGYRGGSLRDIAREPDLSLTSIVHHFGTKFELLEAVLERADKTDGNEMFDFGAACAQYGSRACHPGAGPLGPRTPRNTQAVRNPVGRVVRTRASRT